MNSLLPLFCIAILQQPACQTDQQTTEKDKPQSIYKPDIPKVYQPKPTNFCPKTFDKFCDSMTEYSLPWTYKKMEMSSKADRACSSCYTSDPEAVAFSLETVLRCCHEQTRNGVEDDGECPREINELCDGYARCCSCWCHYPNVVWMGAWAPRVRRATESEMAKAEESTADSNVEMIKDERSKFHCIASCNALREEYKKQNAQHGYEYRPPLYSGRRIYYRYECEHKYYPGPIEHTYLKPE